MAVVTSSGSLARAIVAALVVGGLSGCLATGNVDNANTGTGAGKPGIVATSIEDPMLVAGPVGDNTNGSKKVSPDELTGAGVPTPTVIATNVSPTSASNAKSTSPMMLIPPSGGATAAAAPATPPAQTTAMPTSQYLPPGQAPQIIPQRAVSNPPATPAASTPPAKNAAAKAAPEKMAAAAPPPAPPTPLTPPAPPVAAATPPATLAKPASPAEAEAAPGYKLNIPPPGTKPAEASAPDTNETVVISSATPAPAKEVSHEFIPALVMANASPAPATDTPGSMASRPLTAAEKNVAQRFEVLKALLEQNLITPEEYAQHRNANLGALLPYTHDPAAVGLERPSPSADAVVARLQALSRSLEARAISARQHAMERSMILNALLPDMPTDRMPDMPPPEDVIQAATVVSHLQTLRDHSLISADEFDAERKSIETILRTGNYTPPSARAEIAAKAAVATKQAEVAKVAKVEQDKIDQQKAAKALEDELTSPVPGPVLHLASFRSQDAAKRGWEETIARNKALLGSVHEVIRKVDLGQERGVFYRLMAGPYPSLAAAEAACIKLKEANQFCRASADGS